jgi:hypothetical protein
MTQTKYDEKATLELTLGDFLDLTLALFDAQHYNEKCGYPRYAAKIVSLREKVDAQLRARLEAADESLKSLNT